MLCLAVEVARRDLERKNLVRRTQNDPGREVMTFILRGRVLVVFYFLALSGYATANGYDNPGFGRCAPDAKHSAVVALSGEQRMNSANSYS